MSMTPKPIEVFYSYSHKDEELRDELEKHLSILKRQGVIQSWHDRRIGAGREWEGEIDTHLNTAHVILLLISADFLASDYCYDVEMKRAMERHEAGEACVIPVILRPVDWRGAPFGKLQALPTDAKPVTEWPNRDKAFLDVARGIRAAVEELTGSIASPLLPTSPAPVIPREASTLPPLAKPRRPVKWKSLGTIVVVALIVALAFWAARPSLLRMLSSMRAGTVTEAEVKQWTIGNADKDTVYDIIYNQIHTIPGKREYSKGTTIPSGVLITTDLGPDWSSFPITPVARNGGWGAFRTIDSFKAPAPGEYWTIAVTSATISSTQPTLITSPTFALMQSYDVGEDLQNNCINVAHWEPYAYLSTPQYLSDEVPAPIRVLYKPGCMEQDAQDAYGFHIINGSLVLRNEQEQESTIYGLSTPLPETAMIRLNLTMSKSSTGEVYLGILSKRRANPLSAGETYVIVYADHTIQLVTTALGTLDSYSFAAGRIYNLEFNTSPDALEVDINNGEKVFRTTGDFRASHFMIGYRLKTGQTIETTISDVSIQRR